LTVPPIQALVHDFISLSDLWHRRLAHLHYRALPAVGKIVISVPKLRVEHDGICKGCALGKNAKRSFLGNDNRSKGILDLVHSDLCESMTGSSTGVKPEVGYLRIFGCPIYIHAPKEKRTKLDTSTVQREPVEPMVTVEPVDPVDPIDVLQ